MPDTWDYEAPAEQQPQNYAFRLLTVTLCLLCLLLTIANVSSVYVQSNFWITLGKFGSMDVGKIWDGHWPALFTSVFVHGNRTSFMSTVLHLGFNLLWLLALGRILEDTIHTALTALFFITSAMVASGVEIAISGVAPNGVSGVVYAMFGLMWAGRKQYEDWAFVATPKNMRVFVGWGLFCVVVTRLGWMQIANAAHFGGLAFGLLVGYLFVAKKQQALSALGLVGLGIVTFLSVTYMPWSVAWVEHQAFRYERTQRYADAIREYKHAMAMGADPRLVWARILQLQYVQQNEQGVVEALSELQRLGAIKVTPAQGNRQPQQ
jgi:GlpG protein